VSPAPRSPRPGAAAAWTGTGVLIAGGADHAGGLTDSAIWDPQTDTWTAVDDLPSARTLWGPWAHRTPALQVGEHLLIAHTDQRGMAHAAPLWFFDGGWVPTEMTTGPRREWMAALGHGPDGAVVGLVAGYGSTGPVGELVVLHHGSDRWERLAEVPVEGGEPLAGALVGERYFVVLVGAAAAAYDLDAEEWLELPPGGPSAEGSQVSVVPLPDGFLMLPSGGRFVLGEAGSKPSEDAS
jgi:hypothetical protein